MAAKPSSHFQLIFLCVLLLKGAALSVVVFQPAFLTASGPSVSAFLVGDVSGISFSLSVVSSTNATGRVMPASCLLTHAHTQWNVTSESVGKNAVRVRVRLTRPLRRCGGNESWTQDCCPEPVCVQETLVLTACEERTLRASLLIHAHISALATPHTPASGNRSVIPDQVFQPLGRCPCDLSPGQCDVRCCCDPDCSAEAVGLFSDQCLAGPYGGALTPDPDFHCSAPAAPLGPDWFPFLCVTSPSHNSPYLGLFYTGGTVSPSPRPSFKSQPLPSPVSPTIYQQGDPLFTADHTYFTIPQNSGLGQCVDNAPVAFLRNFESECTRRMLTCPAPPISLGVDLKDGRGGVVRVRVVEEDAGDLGSYLSNNPGDSSAVLQRCDGAVLALRYALYWRGNGLSGVTVTRVTANISLPARLTTRFSAVFLNGNQTSQSYSGNPGYQRRRPVMAGQLDAASGTVQQTHLSLWQSGGDGLCSSAALRPLLFGINSTSGCVLPVSLLDMRNCSRLRDAARDVLLRLVNATLVSRTGKPNVYNESDWVTVTTSVQNSSQPEEGDGSCSAVPTHVHTRVVSVIAGRVQGLPQRFIHSVQISFSSSTWRLECVSGDQNPCVHQQLPQLFSVSSSVTFNEAPAITRAPGSRFSLNFTEFDCDRNDVCWPELLFPLTTYYTGEPHSQALAQGLVLVFFLFAASVLGRPWRQIRQAWSSA